jgi:hypothetical protein
MNKELRAKKCKGCGDKFTPSRPLQIACSVSCAYTVARENGTKKRRKEYREAKERIKTHAEWLKEAQAAVNKYVRARDEGKPCISCGRHHQGQYHAGHYRSVGANPELRFELLNIHKQCSACNNYLSGNIAAYRSGLIHRIGMDAVVWLEGKHEPLHLTIDDIKEIKYRYTRLTKDLLNKNHGL